jgi:nicotinamidase-related amidase
MWTIAGKQVFETLDELVEPSHTALVIVDVQNDYVSNGGFFDQIGLDISMMPSVIAANRALIDAAHEHDVPVVFIQSLRLPGALNESPARLRFMYAQQRFPLDIIVQGTWGAEIPNEIAPTQRDIVVPKFTHNGFVGTVLDKTLRSNGIETVVVTGTSTNGCVEATAKGAYYHDYYVVAAEGACGQPVVTDDRDGASVFREAPSARRVCPDVYGFEEIIDSWNRAARLKVEPLAKTDAIH